MKAALITLYLMVAAGYGYQSVARSSPIEVEELSGTIFNATVTGLLWPVWTGAAINNVVAGSAKPNSTLSN